MEYLIANIGGGIIWLTLFLLRKNLRHEMILMSLFSMPLAILDIFFVPSYWKPVTLFNIPVGIEGFIYSFQAGGIAAVGYAEIFHKVPVKVHKYHKHISFAVLLCVLPIMFLFKHVAKANIMTALYMGLIIGTALTIYLRRDLAKSAVLGALVFGGFYFFSEVVWIHLFPQVRGWFVFEGLPQIYVLGVPLYEPLFALCFGAYWGNLYELVFGYKYKNRRK